MLLCSFGARGQENHYWFQNYGAHSSALGGTVVASWSDNSAIFYNPGAHAFVRDPSISLASDTYTYYEAYMAEGAGPNSSIFTSAVEVNPSLVAGVLTNIEKPGISLSYGFLNIQSFNYNFNKQEEGFVDLLEEAGKEYYIGTYSYKNRIREDWGGLGFSKQFSENFGIGLSLFATINQMDYYNREEARLYAEKDSLATNVLAINTFYNELEFRHVGLLSKLGFAWMYKNVNFGFTITTGRIDLPVVSSRVASAATISIPGQEPDESISIYEEKIRSTFRSPWILDFGIRYKFQDNNLSFRAAYHSRVKAYALIDSSFVTNSDPSSNVYTRFGIPGRAHKSVINLGLGFERNLGDFDLMAAFRTDFNFIDPNAIEDAGLTDFTFSRWNLYHFNVGSTWVYQDRLGVTISIGYAIGHMTDDEQRINLTEPTLENGLFGEPGLTTSSNYFHFSATIGLTYVFISL
jgi:hypothetical protein